MGVAIVVPVCSRLKCVHVLTVLDVMFPLQTITTRAAQLVTAASGWTSLFTYDELTELMKVDVDDVSEMHNLLLVEVPSDEKNQVC